MTTAEKIEAVLSQRFLTELTSECRESRKWISQRYSELKLKTDFATAARTARVEWLEMELNRIRNNEY